MIETSSLRRKLLDLAISGRLCRSAECGVRSAECKNRVEVEKCRGASTTDCTDGRRSASTKPPLPPGWKMVKLEDICSSIADGDHQPPPKSKTGIPFLVISNVAGGTIDFTDTRFVDESYYRSLSENRVARKGDILITVTASYGIAVPVDTERDFCFQRHIAVLKPRGIDRDYLVYALQSTPCQKYFDSVATGTAQKTVGLAPLRLTPIPLPPLAEQKAIVKRLEELLALEREIAADSTAVDDLVVAAKRKILDLAVAGKLTTQNPSYGDARDILKISKCAKKAIKFASINPISPPYEIPKSWAWCRAGELGLMIRGSGIKRNETAEIGLPCVRYGEIYTSYTHRFTKTKSFVSSEMFASCKLINHGDLAFTLTGENKPDIAKTIAYEGTEPVAAGGDLAIWTKHCSDPIYLTYFMSSTLARKQVSNLATGDIVCHISTDKVASIWLPLPPLAEQKAIVAKVDELFSVLDAMKGSQK